MIVDQEVEIRDDRNRGEHDGGGDVAPRHTPPSGGNTAERMPYRRWHPYTFSITREGGQRKLRDRDFCMPGTLT